MPTTVDFPTIVKQALELFGDVFDNNTSDRMQAALSVMVP
jgi:hypothetical protein